MKTIAVMLLMLGATAFSSNVVSEDFRYLQYVFTGTQTSLKELGTKIGNTGIQIVAPGVPTGNDIVCIKFDYKHFETRLIYVCVPDMDLHRAVTSAYFSQVTSEGLKELVPIKMAVSAQALPDCSLAALRCIMNLSSTHQTQKPCAVGYDPLNYPRCYHEGFEGLSKHLCKIY